MTDFRLCLTCLSRSLSRHMPLYSTDDFQPSWAYLMYASVTLWEATAPVKLPALHCFTLRLTFSDEDIIWQQDGVSFDSSRWANAQRLSLTIYTAQLTKVYRYKVAVKVHGVFPSCREYPASSRGFQFHWACAGDSEEVVTSFMLVGTYPTRNFATFGPL